MLKPVALVLAVALFAGAARAGDQAAPPADAPRVVDVTAARITYATADGGVTEDVLGGYWLSDAAGRTAAQRTTFAEEKAKRLEQDAGKDALLAGTIMLVVGVAVGFGVGFSLKR